MASVIGLDNLPPPTRILSMSTYDHAQGILPYDPAHDQRAAAELRPYVYRGLEQRHNLRILKIIGSEADQELACHLNEVKPEELRGVENSHAIGAEGYEALSWTWGTAGRDHVLKIHDDRSDEPKQIKIMGSLHAALVALRHKHASRYLWIDFICINQKDTAERNHQVERMNVIFGSARNVCIWLGNANESSRLAFSFVREHMGQAYAFNKFCEDARYLDLWVHLNQLMRRDWFTRRWILQEVALSKHATVHCGTDVLPWEVLAAIISSVTELEGTLDRLSAMARLRKSLNYEVDFFSGMPQLPAAQLVNVINQFFKRQIGQELQRTSRLEDIVTLATTFECSEPRDTIFAVLALARDCQPTVDDIPHYIDERLLSAREKRVLGKLMKYFPAKGRQQHYIVNYDQPVVEVYADFVRFAILKSTKDRALDIICRPFAYTRYKDRNVREETDQVDDSSRAGHISEDKWTTINLPSWIRSVEYLPFQKNFKPSYEQHCQEAKHFTLSRQFGDPFVSSAEIPSYYTAADRKPIDAEKLRFRNRALGPYSLFVQGFVIDVVGEKTSASQAGYLDWNWIRLGREHDEKYKTDSFWRTLVADRGPRGRMPAFYKLVLKEILGNIPHNGSINLEKYMPHGTSATVVQVMRHIINTVSGRRMIQTKRCHYLGLAPEETEVGDIVCILHGCSVPVIIRKNAKRTKAHHKKEWDERLSELKFVANKLRSIQRLLAERKAARDAAREEATAATAMTATNGVNGVNTIESNAPENGALHANRTTSINVEPASGHERLSGQQGAAIASILTDNEPATADDDRPCDQHQSDTDDLATTHQRASRSSSPSRDPETDREATHEAANGVRVNSAGHEQSMVQGDTRESDSNTTTRSGILNSAPPDVTGHETEDSAETDDECHSIDDQTDVDSDDTTPIERIPGQETPWDSKHPIWNPDVPAEHIANNYDFKVVGECYIDGMMAGQAMARQNASVHCKRRRPGQESASRKDAVRGKHRMWTASFELV